MLVQSTRVEISQIRKRGIRACTVVEKKRFDTGDKVTLNTGDRLELPAGVTHDAVVGKQGVACLEAHG